MKLVLRIVIAATVVVVAALCWLQTIIPSRFGGDNGEHMGHVLREGAEKLSRSGDTELVVEYQPMTGIQQEYSVRFIASTNPSVAPRPGTSFRSYGK
ncbi:MAG: hypothetical protein O2856_17860, partial [Planctomycetota bacterium]|nr:hypothetical protein [Planctomycetota bacterium]